MIEHRIHVSATEGQDSWTVSYGGKVYIFPSRPAAIAAAAAARRELEQGGLKVVVRIDPAAAAPSA